jgi:hypothetical protein
MTNILKEQDLNPTRKNKFHWSAFDKERSDNGLLIGRH